MIRYLLAPVRPWFPEIVVLGTLAATFAALAGNARGDDLLLADSSRWPGTIQISEGATAPREIFRRPAAIAPGDVPKITAVAVSPRGEVFYASGLDGSILRIRRGAEALVHAHRGQVRDIAFGSNPNILYFSVLSTPHNGEPLRDGEVYALDLTSGVATLKTTVAQDEVGRAWWGTFAIHNSELHICTLGRTGKVLKLTDRGWEVVLEANDLSIQGLSFTGSGEPVFVAGGSTVYIARGSRLEVVLDSPGQRLSDVATGTPAADMLFPPTRPAAPLTPRF